MTDINELFVAIQHAKNTEVRIKFREADIILIDDVQFISGLERTQVEFFNTFNTLYELGKQVVFTSDRPPDETHQKVDKLRYLFESGFIAGIQSPDEALRIAITKASAEQLGVVLPDDVINYIADNLGVNIFQLKGALKKLVAYRDFMDADITVASAKKCLKDIVTGSCDAEVLVVTDRIIRETACYYKQAPEDIIGPGRTGDVVYARRVAMYLIHKLTTLSYNDIGQIFDRRDTSTVITTVRMVDKKIQEDHMFSKVIRDIKSNIFISS